MKDTMNVDQAFNILGLHKTKSNVDHINNSFRKLAKKNHPDCNYGDSSYNNKMSKIIEAKQIALVWIEKNKVVNNHFSIKRPNRKYPIEKPFDFKPSRKAPGKKGKRIEFWAWILKSMRLDSNHYLLMDKDNMVYYWKTKKWISSSEKGVYITGRVVDHNKDLWQILTSHKKPFPITVLTYCRILPQEKKMRKQNSNYCEQDRKNHEARMKEAKRLKEREKQIREARGKRIKELIKKFKKRREKSREI